MPIYTYKAQNTNLNKIVKGEGEFDNEHVLSQHLMANQMIPLEIKQKRLLNTDLDDLPLFRPKVKLGDISFFCKQFGVMVQAGISVGGALELCAKQTTNKTLKKHLENITQEVRKGNDLSVAMREEGCFPDLLISMIESGEISGNLDLILNKMSIYFSKQLGIQRKVKKALMYPAMILVVLVIAMSIIMVKVVPGFVSMFADSGVALPPITVFVMAVSDFFQKYWMVMAVVVAIITGTIIQIKKTTQGKRFFDALYLKIPVVSNVLKQTLTATFSDTTALLVTSGVPLLHSMEVVKKVVNNYIANQELETAIHGLRQGETLKEALSESRVFSPLMLNMIGVGEETGELDTMLNKTAEYFTEEAELAIDQMMTLIEPILTIIIAGMVCILVLAVILPSFTLATELM